MAYLLGKIIFRLSGHYLAVATLGFGIVVYLAFGEFGEHHRRRFRTWPVYRGLSIGNFVFDKDIEYYLSSVARVADRIMPLAEHRELTRQVAASARFTAANPRADSMGIDSSRYKLQVLVFSAIYASIAGSLYVHYMRFVSPSAV